MLKKIFLVLVVLVLVGSGVAFYLFEQATTLPDWYAEDSAQVVASRENDVAIAPQRMWIDENGEQLLRDFHGAAARKNPAVAKVVKASRARFKDGALTAGVVVNLAQLPREQLSEEQTALFERVQQAFPGIMGRNVYIGIEDPAPVFRGERMELGAHAKLQLGKLRYSIDNVAGKLGISAAQLRAWLNAKLAQLNIKAARDQ